MSTIQKPVSELKVGDEIHGIETTVFTEPHTVVRVNPAMAITDNGGAFLFNQMGHHIVTVTA